MSAKDKRPIVVIGIGNEFRKDDGAGLAVARRLKEKLPRGIDIREGLADGIALIDIWKNAHAVFVVDAVQADGKPGTLYRWEANDEPLSTCFTHSSTHSVSLVDALSLARVLDRLPNRVVVYGIEGKSFETGKGLSPQVANAVEETVRMVCSDVRHYRKTRCDSRKGLNARTKGPRPLGHGSGGGHA